MATSRSTLLYPARFRRAGFTLVELLVVISIVALLIALLLPALGRARETATRLTCLTNQRAMMLATMMYLNDNDQTMPTSQWYSDYLLDSYLNYSPPAPSGSLMASVSTDDNATPLKDKIYYRDNGCPSFEYGSWVKGEPVFGLNRYMTETNPAGVSCLDHVKNRPDDIRNQDKVYMWTSLRYSVSNTCGGLWHNTGISYVVNGRSGNRAKPRHLSEGLNFCFMDGSGRWISMDYVPGSGLDPVYSPFEPRTGR